MAKIRIINTERQPDNRFYGTIYDYCNEILSAHQSGTCKAHMREVPKEIFYSFEGLELRNRLIDLVKQGKTGEISWKDN